MEIDFKSMSMTELLEIHQEMHETAYDLGLRGSGLGRRTEFHSIVDAYRSCEALHKVIMDAKPTWSRPEKSEKGSQKAVASGENASNSLVTVLETATHATQMEDTAMESNTEDTTAPAKAPRSRKSVKAAKSPTKKAGAKKTVAAKPEKAKAAKSPKPAVEKVVAAPKGERGSKVYPDTAKIHILVDGNPKREGSRQHEEWKLYKHGMKIGTFVEKMPSRKDAIIRISLDVKRGLIEVVQ